MAKQICLRDREKPVPVMKMSEVEETVEWLWYPFYPLGKVTLIQGMGEKEKHGLQWQSPHTVRMEKNFPMHFP